MRAEACDGGEVRVGYVWREGRQPGAQGRTRSELTRAVVEAELRVADVEEELEVVVVQRAVLRDNLGYAVQVLCADVAERLDVVDLLADDLEKVCISLTCYLHRLGRTEMHACWRVLIGANAFSSGALTARFFGALGLGLAAPTVSIDSFEQGMQRRPLPSGFERVYCDRERPGQLAPCVALDRHAPW